MKSISFAGLFMSTLVASASAIPHFNSIFGRTSGDACYTGYGKGTCGTQKTCKGISVGKKYCGGSSGGDYQSQCCVELVCNVPAGKGYCRSVKNGGCPGGSFQSSDYGNSEWPCTGGDIQCCVQGPTPYPPRPDSDNSTSNGTSEVTNDNGSSSSSNGVVNKHAVDMLKELEGFRGDIYKDQVGVDTIGYGHNCQASPGSCEGLKKPINEKEAEDLMMKDLEQFEKCVCDLPNSAGLNSNQFSAMVSFAFNTGCFGMRDYFTDLMNRKDYEGVCNALPTTNTLGGVIKDRRASEGKLCSTPTQQTCGCKGTH